MYVSMYVRAKAVVYCVNVVYENVGRNGILGLELARAQKKRVAKNFYTSGLPFSLFLQSSQLKENILICRQHEDWWKIFSLVYEEKIVKMRRNSRHRRMR
jgi:hypothetical protein